MSESVFAELDDADLAAVRSRVEAEVQRRSPPPETPLAKRVRRQSELRALDADPLAQASEEDVADADPATVDRWMKQGKLASQGCPAPRARR